jgi:hypothetical protein
MFTNGSQTPQYFSGEALRNSKILALIYADVEPAMEC